MGLPRIKYQERGGMWYSKRRGGGHFRTKPVIGKHERKGTKFGKYISKLDTVTNQYVIPDVESKTIYRLGLGERRAFGDAHRDFGTSIQEWFDSLDTETQQRVIRTPIANTPSAGSPKCS